MFTGIVESMGTVLSATEVAGGKRLRLDIGSVANDATPGASIAVNGVCLTVAHVSGQTCEFDVVAETLAKTTLGLKQTGDRVNLERSLRVGDRLDGHFVQGHIEGTARVERVVSIRGDCVVWFTPQDHLQAYIIPKGSIALDGVSLTIAESRDGAFSVALIPTTLQRTTLGAITRGNLVNMESDIITRTVIHHLERFAPLHALTSYPPEELGFT